MTGIKSKGAENSGIKLKDGITGKFLLVIQSLKLKMIPAMKARLLTSKNAWSFPSELFKLIFNRFLSFPENYNYRY